MSRPRLCRRIRFNPNITYFKPQGLPMRFLEEVDLGSDELEALRLCDFKELGQREAAKKMGVSQSTLQRILCSARKKVAEALTEGRAIKIRS